MKNVKVIEFFKNIEFDTDLVFPNPLFIVYESQSREYTVFI
jgi:hypothetical protein